MGYCGWAGETALNKTYHDEEWGVPIHDDRRQFEHLSLEVLQCGLSWSLMLK
ncbi:MAG: DNA-3-methyladenine glycosylase I, partial [Clostridiales bacterium]|nr:DNA-3-methyladenine glycosylase I [Clostridiales bacterium]